MYPEVNNTNWKHQIQLSRQRLRKKNDPLGNTDLTHFFFKNVVFAYMTLVVDKRSILKGIKLFQSIDIEKAICIYFYLNVNLFINARLF